MSETPKLQLEVVGAGFGRTGTVSTREAMRILGFWPNYHMAEAAINQSAFTRFASRMAVKFGSTSGPNLPPFKGNHFTLWTEATLAKRQGDDKRVKEILVKLLNGYKSNLDYPSSMFYKELHELCPNSPVLLTIRDSPEAWAKSIMGSIGLITIYFDSWYHFIPALFHGLGHRSMPAMIKVNACGGDVKNWQDKKWLCEEYERHIAEVKSTIPEDKLVVFNVKEGWKPLCEKLGVKVQEGDFPRLNDSENIKKNLQVIKVVDTIMWLVLIGVLVGIGFGVAIFCF